MRVSHLLIALMLSLAVHGQIWYESLRLSHDSLYSFAGHLCSGQAVWRRSYSGTTLTLTFKLQKGKIIYHGVNFSKNGKPVIDAFYDDTERGGEAKMVASDGSLACLEGYYHEERSAQFYESPTGGLYKSDSIITRDLKLHREYFRNGMIKAEDSIFGKMNCQQEWDSLGTATKSATGKTFLFDRLFGPTRFGFKWHTSGAHCLDFDIDSRDKDYLLKIRYNNWGGFESINWGETIDSLYFGMEFYPNSIPRNLVFKRNGDRHYKRWDKNGVLRIHGVLTRQKFNTMSEHQRNELSDRIYFKD